MKDAVRLLLVAAAICLCLPAGSVLAEGGAPGPKVGIYLLNVTDFDPSNGMFGADFYLNIDSPVGDPTRFEIMNGYIESKSDLTVEPGDYIYRVRSRNLADMDFRDYPFDRHQLTIVLEDELQDEGVILYQADRESSGIDAQVRVPGWDVDPVWHATVDSHRYDIYDQTYSRYTFRISIGRKARGVMVKYLLPAFLVVLGGFFSLLLGVDHAVSRLAVLTASQIASVVLHLNLSSAIPPVGYMTFADRFMVINYLALVGAIGLTGLTVKMLDRKRADLEARLSRLVVLIPGVWLVLHLVNVLSLFWPH